MSSYRVISADSHVQDPDSLYKERLPVQYRHRAPRIVEENGARYRVFDGQNPTRLDLVEVRLTEEDRTREFRSDRSGGSNIPLRLADLKKDGITAEIIYPNAIFHFYTSPSSGFQAASSRILNDWLAEVFGSYPAKFIPSAVLAMVNIKSATKEANRVAKLGFRTLSVPVAMPNLPYDAPEYESFWSTLEELGLPLNFHVFTRKDWLPAGLGEEEGRGQDLSMMALGMAEAMSPLTMLVASGVLQRHPRFRFVLVECGIGWLAWFLYALDELHRKRHMWHRPLLEMLPSEYFKRQGFVTFGEDPVGLHNRDFTGVDCLMWGSDYPHDESTFPHSRKVIEETFRGVPEDEKRKIVGGNAAKLYGVLLN